MSRSVSVNAPSCDVEFLGEIHSLIISVSQEASFCQSVCHFLQQTFIVPFPPAKDLWQARTQARELCRK